MKKDLNENFCLTAFNNVSISPRGIIRPCCWQHSPDMYTHPNIQDHSDNVTWPTEYVAHLREVMLSQEDIPSKTPECGSCWHGEKNINWSQRKSYNYHWFEELKLTSEEIKSKIDNPRIDTVDMQFGYLCNNSCIMCTPSQSSHLHTTHIKLSNITTKEKQRDFYNSRYNFLANHKKDWTDNPQSFEKVKGLCEDATEIKISGGEPLMNSKLKIFLEFLITKKVPINYLMLTTNGTIYDSEVVDLLNRIPSVTFKISLEAMGAQEEFIRWPTDWKEKEENTLRFMQTINATKTLFLFSSVIQSLNIFHLADVKKYTMSLNPNRQTKFQLQVANDKSVASLWNVEDSYLDNYLSLPKEQQLDQVTQHVKLVKGYKGKEIDKQVTFYRDMASIQKKNFDSIFPLYYQHHISHFK